MHCKPGPTQVLHSHPVTKKGKTWNVSFQCTWLEKFPWLSYSNILEGGICRYCILFPENPTRGGSQGANPGVLVLTAYRSKYSKALGKDGVLVCHEQTQMHRTEMQLADTFLQTQRNPSVRVDSLLLRQQSERSHNNREILREFVRAVEFLAKQGLSFRGHHDSKVDFSEEESNKGNFITALQLLGKSNSLLQKHLLSAQKNAKYSSKTVQNEVIHIYASKIKENVTKQLREDSLPFTVIAEKSHIHIPTRRSLQYACAMWTCHQVLLTLKSA